MPDDHITPTDRYYSERVARSDDLLWQVGKTVNGEPVDRKQLQLIVGQIVSLLDLTPEDRVLDIGAGNGPAHQPGGATVCPGHGPGT